MHVYVHLISQRSSAATRWIFNAVNRVVLNWENAHLSLPVRPHRKKWRTWTNCSGVMGTVTTNKEVKLAIKMLFRKVS